MRRVMAFVVACVANAVVLQPSLSDQGSPPTLSVHPLKNGVYWIEGGVANTGFIVGDKGVVVIDAQKTVKEAKEVLVAISKLTAKPVDSIILTHGDPDHVWGLPAYDAATIISQENAKSVIEASAADPADRLMYGGMYGELLSCCLPTRTVGATESTVLDGIRMDLIYVGPAHTSGDLIVYLPAQKVLFAGDIIITNAGRFPVIHVGGSSLGWIAAMKAVLDLDVDVYVSGHGLVETKSQLRTRLRDAEQRRAQIKLMVDQDKTEAEVENALPDVPPDPRFLSFGQTTYRELTKGYPPAQAPWVNIVRTRD